MVFKIYVYKLRVISTLNFSTFLYQLVKVKTLEKGAAFNNKQKHDMFLKKCFRIFLMNCLFFIYFVPKRCSLKTVVPQCKNMKKDNL